MTKKEPTKEIVVSSPPQTLPVPQTDRHSNIPNQETLNKFLQLQTEELKVKTESLKVKAEELKIKEKEIGLNTEIAKQTLEAQLKDRELTREHSRKQSKYGLIFLTLAIFCIAAIIIYALHRDKEAIVKDLMAAVVQIVIAVVSFYIGRASKPNQPETPSQQNVPTQT